MAAVINELLGEVILIAQRNYNVSPPAQPVEVEKEVGDTTGLWVLFGIIPVLIFGYFLFFASRDDSAPQNPTIEQNQKTTPVPPAKNLEDEPAPETTP